MKSVSVTFHIPEDRELLAAIGELSLRHEKLNYILRLTIKSLSKDSLEKVMKKTKYMGAKKLRKQVDKQAKSQLQNKKLLNLQRILRECESVTLERNDLIHGMMTLKKCDDTARIRDSLGNSMPVPAKESVLKLSAKIEQLANNLDTFRRLDFS